jgi:hypothetical protein
VAFLDRLKPSPAKAKAPRPVRQRVFLSKEENREVHRLRPLERKIAFGLAAYAAIASSIIHFNQQGTSTVHLWKWTVLMVAAIFFAFAAWRTNRIVVGLGALVCVYLPVVEGAKVASVFFLPLAPLYVFMVWLFVFKINKDRKAATQARIERGDLGTDYRTASRQSRSSTPTATTDAAGRALATKSKRYTPPKAKPTKK